MKTNVFYMYNLQTIKVLRYWANIKDKKPIEKKSKKRVI